MNNSQAFYKPEKRSEEVNEVLSNMPRWMTRWGVMVFLSLIISFFAVGWFVKLPDTISGEIQLITKVPPVSMIGRANGEIKFLVHDNQHVTGDANLAVIENTANTEEMLTIMTNLNAIESNLTQTELDPAVFKHTNLHLGEVQSAYLQYCKAATMYFEFQASDFYTKQKTEIKQEMSYMQQIMQHLQQSADKQSQSRVNSTKVIDPVFGEKEKVKGALDYGDMTQEKLANDNMINIIQYKMKASQMAAKIAEIDFERDRKKQQLRLDLEESYRLLQTQIMMWKSRYLLTAPFDGTVSLYKFWNDHQFVSAGEEIMTILPDNQQIIGKIRASAMGMGKVEAGQPVFIKLYNFPHDEYGVVEGEVQSISTVSREKQYVINVSLKNGLHTSYGKEIKFKQEMAGRASIIVKDLRLFERIFKDFLKF